MAKTSQQQQVPATNVNQGRATRAKNNDGRSYNSARKPPPPSPVPAPRPAKKGLPKKRKGPSPVPSRSEEDHEEVESTIARAGKRKRTVTPEETNGRKKPRATKKATVQLEEIEEEDKDDSGDEIEFRAKTTKGKGKVKVEKKAVGKGKKPVKAKEPAPVDDDVEEDEDEEVPTIEVQPAGGAKFAETSTKFSKKRKKPRSRMDEADRSLWTAISNAGTQKATTKPNQEKNANPPVNAFHRRGGAVAAEPDSEDDEPPVASPPKRQGTGRDRLAQTSARQPRAGSKRKRDEEGPVPPSPKRPRNAQEEVSDHASNQSSGLSDPPASLKDPQGQEKDDDEASQANVTPTPPDRPLPGQKSHSVDHSAPPRSNDRSSQAASHVTHFSLDERTEEERTAQPLPAAMQRLPPASQQSPPAPPKFLALPLRKAIIHLDDQIKALVQQINPSRLAKKPAILLTSASSTLQELYKFILRPGDWLEAAAQFVPNDNLREVDFLQSLIWAFLFTEILRPEEKVPWDSPQRMNPAVLKALSEVGGKNVEKLKKKTALTMLRDEEWQQRTLLFHTHVLAHNMILELTDHIFQLRGKWKTEDVQPICESALLFKGMMDASEEQGKLVWNTRGEDFDIAFMDVDDGERILDTGVGFTMRPGLYEIDERDGADGCTCSALVSLIRPGEQEDR